MQIETKAHILCALCGVKFIPDNANICNACTLASVQQQKVFTVEDVHYCRFCQRYERPPWINCQRESKEMLGLVLKKVKGLNHVKMLDAKFIWTQPHSKRMKVKITFEKEINSNMKLQQTQVLQFVQVYVQCNDCKKQFTPHDWNTVVQIRQYADHKRTVSNLEQLIIKKKLNEKMLKLEDAENGFDVFFKRFELSKQFVDFVKSSLPCTIKTSKQFVSANERDNTAHVKTTIAISIPKICKDDLVRIPMKLAKQLGGCCQLLICTKVTSLIHFVDVNSFRKYSLTATQYFLYESMIIAYPLKIWGKMFQILDCQATKTVEGNLQYPIYNLSIMKQDQFKEIYARSHFKQQCGNDVQGYDLTTNDDFQGIKNCPDYIIVKRHRNKEIRNKLKQEKKKAQRKNKQKSELGDHSEKPKKEQKEKPKVGRKPSSEEDWESDDSDFEFDKQNQEKLRQLNQKMQKMQLNQEDVKNAQQIEQK